ncbi:hypothetical protein H072_6330 [Dactylellina haptotyla CBS 200.50]|uniref:Uncharacterized protein n=1 Tax=Dactylellina haptotyla (strain CBS 200.50) TaxID=1284197 RepID=S8AFG0_DACHA|nr:hypothetical protein H072_6330 [Dactylellina haptotyla CBS 200.50]
MSTETTTAGNTSEELKIQLKAGEMKLYSSFTPVLPGGDYVVSVQHELKYENDASPRLNLATTKKFSITAPRYTLAPGDVYSSFPHPGHGEEAKVLPHVLLADPHLPWARDLNLSADSKGHPWMGILSFATKELESNILAILSTKPNLSYAKPSQTLSYNLKLGDLWSLQNEIVLPLSPIEMAKPDDQRPDGEKSTDSVDVAFLPAAMFEQLFCEVEANGTKKISVKNFRYMSHVRMVNSEGTIKAGDGGPTNAQYGVVIGPRSGPVEPDLKFTADLTQPIPMIAHLFSLEGIQSLNLEDIKRKGFVGLISLYSWAYESLPPKSANYYQILMDLGKNIQPLRFAANDIDKITKETGLDKEQQSWLRERLEAGYSFMRFRPSTGEQTTGIFRGALVPQISGVSTLPQASNVGSDMQIIDCTTGVPDLTYHLAWELGRSLGSSDRVFSAAILRLRTRINNEAQDRARGGSSQARGEAFDRLGQRKKGRSFVGGKSRGRREQSMLRRWNKRKILPLDPEDEETDLKADDEIVSEIRQVTAKICQNMELPTKGEEIRIVESSKGKSKATDSSNTANSTSWVVIVQWIVEKLMLFNIPNIYLYPEPHALPEEAFRTFYIDEVWMDAFLDGALSVANHRFYSQVDYIRNELKVNINMELKKGIYQLPKWGFIMRSKVVLAFPDLRVQAPWSNDKEARSQVARMQRLAPDTLLCLFDRQPGDGSFKAVNSIVIKEPPHQQKFSVGDSLEKNRLQIVYRLLPTATAQGSQQKAKERSKGKTEIVWLKQDSQGKATAEGVNYTPPHVYNWDTRCLNTTIFAETCFKFSQKILEKDLFDAPQTGSALTGIQLNDEPMTLNVNMPDAITAVMKTEISKSGLRQLPILEYEENNVLLTKGHLHATAASLTDPFPRKHNFPFPRIRQVNPPPKLKFRAATKVVDPLSPPVSISSADATATQLEKAVFALHQYSCNIPVDNPGAIDLVFSISARRNISKSIALKSLTVILPGGKSSADLLRVTRKDATKLTVLPSARFIGKGSRWLAESRECDALAQEFIHTKRKGPLPTTTLAVRVVPRGKLCPLANMPDLSFILNGVELNDSPSADVKIIFQEEYSVRVEGTEQLKTVWNKTEPVFNSLTVEKQRGI